MIKMPVRTSFEMNQSQLLDDVWGIPSSEASLYMDLGEDEFRMTFFDLTPSEIFPSIDTFDAQSICDFNDILATPASPKYQIRHHDCMWSGTCVDKSHPNKKKGMFGSCTAATAATTETATTTQQQQQTNASSSDNTVQAVKPTDIVQKIISNKQITSKNIMSQNILMKTVMKADKIPAGRSLLISRNNSILGKDQKVFEIKSEKKDVPITVHNMRPDTPLSLGDDPPESKQNVDDNKAMKINMWREHLENCSNDTFLPSKCQSQCTVTDINDILEDLQNLSDYEMDDDGVDTVDMDDDCDESMNDTLNSDYNHEDDMKTSKITKLLSNAVIQSENSRSNQTKMQQQLELTMNQPEYMGDHSYTRPKSRYDLVGLGVQTPSDSEEEIDVVSVGEKTLPTNPSARDRRQLQTTVANKIRSKNQTQRRRCSDDDLSVSSLSPLSSQGTTPTKNYVSNILSSYSNNTSTTSRKRQIHKDTNNNENNDSTTPNVKRYKSSNINNNNSNNNSNSSSTKKRASNAKSKSDTDELETIEKRNLHNNMERQRRIGLKNLFEELKQQIPSLKDKERAPKVNILREAATYCTKLRTDDDIYADLWKKNQRLVARINNLKKSMGPLAHHVLAQRKYT